MQRFALFGGTFDPVHSAHLKMAQAAAEQCKVSRVLLIPASDPPHRARGTFAGYEDRFRMVEIACDDQPMFEPSRLEAGPGKSYSVDTVERFRASVASDEALYFVIGADAFAEIRSWYRWLDLARLVTFAVVGRPGAIYEVPPETSVQRVDGVDLPISSSEIRGRLANGEVDVDLPPGVLDYIHERGLYGVRG